ncbi:hypothetical protein [Reichenbachiella faecimaris]|uniref:hypothetical protein n=1 Tax=Reichenbachiella faecimaris TaxID=692418 RepID=UPI00111C5ECF|nr:hypothetical protein [Reichenbachiella faecimaris]
MELHKIEKSEIEKDNEKITKNYRQTDAGELVKAKEKELQQTTFEETVQQFSLDTTATSTNLSKEAKAAIKSYIEQVSELNKELEKSDLKTITFGVSFGAKWWEDQIYDYAINPIDSTLISDELEKTALNFATNIAFTPFLHSDMINHRIEKWRNKNFLKTIGYQALRNLSFVVTIDVARISDDESSFEFLESVDGAIGLGYRLGKNFFVAYTWDWQKVRQLRSDFNQNKTQLLDLNGQIVTEIDLNNDTLFRDRVIRKNGVLFIWSF